MKIRDRIKELRRVPASELAPNPKNWRTHPQAQQDAMRGILAEIGYAGAALAYETPEGLRLIDGHLRTEITPDQEVPVLVLDVTDEEADKILATFDPVASLAEMNSEALARLAKDLESNNDILAGLVWPDYVLDPLKSADWSPADIMDLDEHQRTEGHSLKLTGDQWAVIKQAVDRVKEASDDQTISEGRAVELICGDYLAGT